MSRYPALPLAGATVAITGGAQGIGRATAELFAKRGAHVAIGDLDLDAANETAARIGATAHRLDVSDLESYRSFLAAATAAHGELDVLVNNAGVMPNGGLLDIDLATDRMTVGVNLFGVIHGIRLAVPGMVERGRGHVVNVASLAGKFAVPGLAIYCASKHAVVGLSTAARRELDATGVSVTTVLPSAVDTALASGLNMRPIPKASAEHIAAAVVGSVGNRRAEIAVPAAVGALTRLAAVTPEPLMRQVRRLMRDDRALQDGGAARAAYAASLAAQRDNR